MKEPRQYNFYDQQQEEEEFLCVGLKKAIRQAQENIGMEKRKKIIC